MNIENMSGGNMKAEYSNLERSMIALASFLLYSQIERGSVTITNEDMQAFNAQYPKGSVLRQDQNSDGSVTFALISSEQAQQEIQEAQIKQAQIQEAELKAKQDQAIHEQRVIKEQEAMTQAQSTLGEAAGNSVNASTFSNPLGVTEVNSAPTIGEVKARMNRYRLTTETWEQGIAIDKIIEERKYQDLKHGPLDQHGHSVGEWLNLIQEYTDRAWNQFSPKVQSCNNPQRIVLMELCVMAEVRRIAAVALAAMEQHKTPERSIPSHMINC